MHPEVNLGENLFHDVDPEQKKQASEFYLELCRCVKEWGEKFGKDSKGRETPFLSGLDKTSRLASVLGSAVPSNRDYLSTLNVEEQRLAEGCKEDFESNRIMLSKYCF